MIEEAVRRIARELAGAAPEGWTRAVLSSTAHPGSVSVTGEYTVPGSSARHGHVPSPFDELGAVAGRLRETRGWESVSLEVTCRPDGAYELVAVAAAITGARGGAGGFQAVLDPARRLPQPGAAQATGTAAPAGDARLAVTRFRTYLERRAAILGGPEPLPPPATAAALAEAERRLGSPLPADLRALYALADGDSAAGRSPRYLLGGYGWLGLEALVDCHARLREPYWPGWELGWNGVVFDADPPDTVRRCGGHPAWLPFATGEDGNYLAVDLSPARDGRPGQVILIGRDHHDSPALVADSVTSLLAAGLDALDRGSYEAEDGDLYVETPEPRYGPERVIGALPGAIPPGLQALHLNDAAGHVDLTPLTAAPRLRLLHLNRSVTADLAPVRALPVESLRVTLDGGGLAPLAGHPQLTSLDLRCAAPADLAPLRTVPGLHGLDLAGAEVRDLGVLADLPGLRYLALTARQWDVLLERGVVPEGLAAARLADTDASLDDALAWAARLGLDLGEPFRQGGALE